MRRRRGGSLAVASANAGPICLDLPPQPNGYTGVIPDELDCSSLLPRARGYGDGACATFSYFSLFIAYTINFPITRFD